MWHAKDASMMAVRTPSFSITSTTLVSRSPVRHDPRCSVVETDIYNPALPGSRFGEPAEALAGGLPDGIEGLHFHALCEGSADDLRLVLEAFESQFGHLLDKVKWVNMGGGHLMTREAGRAS